MFREYDDEGKLISTRVYEDHFPTEWAEKLSFENFQQEIDALGEYEGEDVTTIDINALMSYSRSLNRDNISATFDHCTIIENGETRFENVLAMNKSISAITVPALSYAMMGFPSFEDMEVVSIRPPSVYWMNYKGLTWSGYPGKYYYLPDEDGTYETALIVNTNGEVIGAAIDYDYDGRIEPNNFKIIARLTVLQTHKTWWLNTNPLTQWWSEFWLSPEDKDFTWDIDPRTYRPEFDIVQPIGDSVFDFWKLLPISGNYPLWRDYPYADYAVFMDNSWHSILYWDSYFHAFDFMEAALGAQLTEDLAWEIGFGISSVIVSTIVTIGTKGNLAAGAAAGAAVYTLEHLLYGLDKERERMNEIKKNTFRPLSYLGELILSRKIEGDQYDTWEQLWNQLPVSITGSPALKTIYIPVQGLSERFMYTGHIISSKGYTTATKNFNFYTNIMDVNDPFLTAQTLWTLMSLSAYLYPYMQPVYLNDDGSRVDDLEANPYYGNFISNCPFLNVLLYYPTNSIPYLEEAAMHVSSNDDLLATPYDRVIPTYSMGVPGFSFASSEGPLILPDFYEEYPLMVKSESPASGSDVNNIMFKFSMANPAFSEEQFTKLRTFEVLPQDAIHPLKSAISSIDVIVFVPWHLSGPDLEDILDGYTEDNFASGSTLPIILLTLTPSMFEYDNVTREVTINEDAFDIIKSKIRALPCSLLFAYKINIETVRSIYDPNDDISVAQAQKMALMQSVQMVLLDYVNEFSLGAARGQMDYQTAYTLVVTTISTAVTVAAGVVSSLAVSASGVLSGVAKVGAEVTKQVVPASTRHSLVVLQAAISIVSENLEELFLDPFIESVVTDLVEDLGGDESAKVFWSVLAESIREGLMGPISSTTHINIMENLNNFIYKHQYGEAINTRMGEILAQQAANELRELRAEQQAAGTMSNIPLSAISSLSLYTDAMKAQSFAIPPDATLDQAAQFFKGLTAYGLKGDVFRALLRSMHTADDTQEITGTQEIAPGITAEVSDPQRYALTQAAKEQKLLAAIEKQAPLTPELVDLFREVHPQGFTGIPGYDPILDLMDYAQFHNLPVEHMTFWGAQPARINNLKDAIRIYEADPTRRHPAIQNNKFTEEFRKWYETKTGGLVLPQRQFSQSEQFSIIIGSEIYSMLYSKYHDQIRIDQRTKYIERIISKMVKQYVRDIIPKAWREFRYIDKDLRRSRDVLLRKFELLFSVEAVTSESECILSQQQRDHILDAIQKYRNTYNIHESENINPRLLDSFEILQKIQEFYFYQTGRVLNYPVLCQKMDFSENYYSTRFYVSKNRKYISWDDMLKIQNWVIDTKILSQDQKDTLLKDYISKWWSNNEPHTLLTIIIKNILELWSDAFDETISIIDLDEKISELTGVDSKSFFTSWIAENKMLDPESWDIIKKFIEREFLSEKNRENLKKGIIKIKAEAERIISEIDIYLKECDYFYKHFTKVKIHPIMGDYAHYIIEWLIVNEIYKAHKNGEVKGKLGFAIEQVITEITERHVGGEHPDITFTVDEIFKYLFIENEQHRVRLEHDKEAYIPSFEKILKYEEEEKGEGKDEKIYVTIDFTMSINWRDIKKKLYRGYVGKNRHLIIVIYGLETLKEEFKDDLTILRELVKKEIKKINFEGQVDIITLEQFGKFFDFECLNKEGINDLNERLKKADESGSGLLGLKEYAEEKWNKLTNLLSGQSEIPGFIGNPN
jgi:hypothetical protein